VHFVGEKKQSSRGRGLDKKKGKKQALKRTFADESP
jgi:hypothetical protein